MHQTRDEVQWLLSALDPAYRVPVVLRHWYDMPCQEIAEMMGIGEGTVKMRLYRAREKLAREAQKVRQPQRHLMQKPDVSRSTVNRRSTKKDLLLGVWCVG
jgi:DNA-directed RNA polymerase specialized sigma24 family protein